MYLPKILNIRVTRKIISQIYEIIENDEGEKYDNLSHFVRCAIIKQIREENASVSRN